MRLESRYIGTPTSREQVPINRNPRNGTGGTGPHLPGWTELGFTLFVYKQAVLDDRASIGLDRDFRLSVQPNLPYCEQLNGISAEHEPL